MDTPVIEFVEPWSATTDQLHGELEQEVGRGHPLKGKRAVTIGRRYDCDDVLFYLPDGPSLLAVVHLTWARRREKDARFPWTELFESVEQFVSNRMLPDRDEWNGR